jgi:Flp pilus assembly protein TadD
MKRIIEIVGLFVTIVSIVVSVVVTYIAMKADRQIDESAARIETVTNRIDSATAKINDVTLRIEKSVLDVKKRTERTNKILGEMAKQQLAPAKTRAPIAPPSYKETPNQKAANMWFAKGLEAAKKEDFELAKDCFQKAIEFDPNKATAYFNLALMCNKLGNNEKTIMDNLRKSADLGYPQAQKLLKNYKSN